MTPTPSDRLAALLRQGLREHQQGRLDGAQQTYQQILAQSPRHPDALHLLGLIAHQRGDHRQAIEWITQAIDVFPNNPAFYSNIAEAHRALGQSDLAVERCRQALRLKPDSLEIANNLALALTDCGIFDEAESLFLDLLRKDPGSARAHNNIGNVYLWTHRRRQAAAEFAKAIDLDPALAEAHSNFGRALLELGDADTALAHCREALRLAPQMPAAHCNFGNVLRKLGQLDEAKQAYASAIRLQPNLGTAYNNMGQVFEEEGLLDEALAWFDRALEHDPRSAHTHTSVGRVLASKNRRDAAALASFQRALELDPRFAEAYDGWGAMLLRQDDLDQALVLLRKSVQCDPDLASAHGHLGHCLALLDRRCEAIASLREALRCDPLYVSAYKKLAAAVGPQLEEDDARQIQQIVDRRLVSPRRRADLHFALANVRDAQRWFNVAAVHANQANAIRHQLDIQQQRVFDAEAHIKRVGELIDAFSSEFFEKTRGWGLDTETPVFHVGLPRAGKSLAERILAAHPDVYGAGELHLGDESFEAFPGVLGLDDPPIKCVDGWTRQSVIEVANMHFSKLQSLAPGAARIIDTMPHNYLALGTIATLFPRAKIVHCRRDLRDLAIACWMKDFKHLTWAFDAEQLASRIGQYRRIMQHWRRVLPIPVLELEYEQIVSDPEPVARQLVEFVGLEWHDACRELLEQPASVPGAQWHDARPPFTNQFVGRWKHYRDSLAPVLQALE